MVPAAELSYQTNATAVQMAETIFGDGVVIVDATYDGAATSSAIYSGGDALAEAATPGDEGVILSTGVASNYTNSSGFANQRPNTSTNTTGVDGDGDFDDIAGLSTFDASILTVDFIPDASTYSIQFTYSSEEYPEFVNSIFNDIVGVWINDEYVEIAVGSGDNNIGNINAGNNENLFVDNAGSVANTEMDGFTVTLTLTLNVNPGVLNTIRIGIADVGDANFDSNLLIAGGSIQSEVLLEDDSYDIVLGGTRTIDVLGNDTAPSTLTITHINGQEVMAGDTVSLATGQDVTLNADGTFTVANDFDLETINFTYQAETTDGISDVAFVNITTIPCFVAGTLIETDRGERPVESLRAGDLVNTVDDGLQPIRWVGHKEVETDLLSAPVRIAAGTFGTHRELAVSPQHRLMLKDYEAQLLFGESEVLIAAKDLVNGSSVQRCLEAPRVIYVHLLFDKHQVIYANGLTTESFLPGPYTLKGFSKTKINEIRALFPEFDPATGKGYGPSARYSLKSHEARLLMEVPHAA